MRWREGYPSDLTQQERDRVGTVTDVVVDQDDVVVEATVQWFGEFRPNMLPPRQLEVLFRDDA